MQNEPQNEHQWLQRLVGEWVYESVCSMEPGKSPSRFEGTESVRSLGGLWVLCEGHGEMPGGGMATTLMTLGYDPQTKRYVGTWVGSMMSHLWVYEGSLNAEQNVLTLNTEGPSCREVGPISKYRDVIEFKSEKHRVLTSQVQGEDGTWRELLRADYQRKA